MRKKQVLSLFFCMLGIYVMGNGLIPLLPIYAQQLGAGSALAGYYLSFSYTAIAVGAISSGWVSDKLGHRKIPIIIFGLVSIPIAWLMGRAGNILYLSLLTAVLWYCGGLMLGLINILTGLSAGEGERGKIFGILSLTGGLGGLIGCLAIGYLVDRWGFATMFAVMALFMSLVPISGFFLGEKVVKKTREDEFKIERRSLGRNYYHLFSASLIAMIASFVILFGRSLLMSDLIFSELDVSITGAVAGVVAMPLPFLMGWLSDRTGRKIFLYLGYLMCIISLAILASSFSLWHFILVLALQAIFVGVNTSIGNAFVTDLVPQESLGRGLALFGATTWIGGIIGFACTGYAIQTFGTLTTFLIAMCLPLIGMLILIPVPSRVKR